MKTLDITKEYSKTVFMIVTHKIKGLKNIVVSGSKLYQLPCQIGKRSFELKEIIKRKGFYLIESKRYSSKQLKELAYKRADKIKIDEIPLYPFTY